MVYHINVGCWLVDRFAIVPKKNSEPMHCLAGSLLWQEILGCGAFLFVQKNVCVNNLNIFFLKKNIAFLPVPKESDRLLNPY